MHLPAGGSGVGEGNVTSILVLCLTATTDAIVVLQLLITTAAIQAYGGGVPDLNKMLYCS